MQEASYYPSQNNNSNTGNNDDTNATLVSHLVNQAHKLSYEDQLQKLNKFHSERLAQNLLKISKKIENNKQTQNGQTQNGQAQNNSNSTPKTQNNTEMQGLRNQVGARQSMHKSSENTDDWRMSLQREIDAQVKERLDQDERRKREQYAMLNGFEGGGGGGDNTVKQSARYKYRSRKNENRV